MRGVGVRIGIGFHGWRWVAALRIRLFTRCAAIFPPNCFFEYFIFSFSFFPFLRMVFFNSNFEDILTFGTAFRHFDPPTEDLSQENGWIDPKFNLSSFILEL